MELIKCPDCGKEISVSALSCPNCGRPNNQPSGDKLSKKKPFLVVGAAVIFVLLALGFGIKLQNPTAVKDLQTYNQCLLIIEQYNNLSAQFDDGRVVDAGAMVDILEQANINIVIPTEKLSNSSQQDINKIISILNKNALEGSMSIKGIVQSRMQREQRALEGAEIADQSSPAWGDAVLQYSYILHTSKTRNQLQQVTTQCLNEAQPLSPARYAELKDNAEPLPIFSYLIEFGLK